MAKKNYRTVSKNKGWKVLAVLQFIVSIALAIVIVCAVGSEGFTKKDVKTWFKKDQEQNQPDDSNDEDTTNMLLSVCDYNDNSTMLMTMTPIEENGIAAQSETSNIFVLEATPQPFPWGSVTWSCEYENPDSWFAKSYQIDDVITVTPQGELTATVECNQAFAEPIIITTTLSDNESITASCKADYLQSLKSVKPVLNAEVNGTNYSFTGGSPFFTLDSAPDLNEVYYQVTLSGVYTIPYQINNVTVNFSVKIHENIASGLNIYIKAGAPGAVGATDWTVIDTSNVSIDVAGSTSTGNQIYNVAMTGLKYSNSANFCSVFYPAMLGSTGRYNDNLLYFLKTFDSLFNAPGMSSVNYLNWYYTKVEMSVDGESKVYESGAVITRNSITTANSMLMNESNIVFKGLENEADD